MLARSFSERKLDLLYFVYFTSHIVFTLFCDCILVYPIEWIPKILIDLNQFQVNLMKDPLMNVFKHQYLAENYYNLMWFRTFVFMELCLQLPFFFFAAYKLYYDQKSSLKISGLIYSSHVITTVAPILAIAIFGSPELNFTERLVLCSVYGPFLLIPLILMIDLVLLNNNKTKKE